MNEPAIIPDPSLRKLAPRDVTETIDAMLAVIPASFVGLIADIKRARASSLYRSPESQWITWGELSDTLAESIGEPVEPWQIQVRDIFTFGTH